MYIYKTTNLINGKIYIGKSEKDFNENYYGSGLILKKAIKKYGKDNFIVELIEKHDNIDSLNDREKYWIDYHSKNSYNIAEGGSGGWTIKGYNDEEYNNFVDKMTKINRDKSKHVSKIISDMWEDKNSIYNTEEYRNKLSDACKIRKWSDKTKDKIRQSKLGANNPQAQKVKVGNVIYDTITECAKDYSISNTAVRKRCNNKNFPDWGYN